MKDQKDQDSHKASQSDQTTDPSRRELLKLSGIAVGAVGRTFVSPGVSMADPAHFAAFRGGATPLDSDKNTTDANGNSNFTRLQWDVRRGLSRIINHPWTPTTGPDAVRVRGFIYDVDTGLLSEVFLTGAAGELGPFDAGLPFC